ncbi:MAG: ATP-binding protein [Anaerolineae bacterium]|nr:ATP-binding protein [Anaerolineae bacterium]
MTGNDHSLHHLQAELRRIDARIRREVRRWELAGQDPADRFRGLTLSDAQAHALAARPFATSWGQTVALPPQEAQTFAALEAEAVQEIEMLARAAQPPTRLQRLAATFGLERFDLDALLVALAPALDVRYEQVYGYLQDDVTRKAPTVDLVLNLLSEPGPARLARLAHFADDAPLIRHRLVERHPLPGSTNGALLSQSLHPDPAIVAWLLGHYQPGPALAEHIHLLPPREAAEDQLLSAEAWPEVADVLPLVPVVVFYGIDGSAQRAAARRIAAHSGRALLHVDMAALAANDTSLLAAVEHALRDARLIDAIPYLTGWDACLAEDVPQAGLLAAVCAHPGMVVIAGWNTWQVQGIDRDRNLHWVAFPIPTYAQRKALWHHFAGQTFKLGDLAGQFALTSGQIRDAVATARDLAVRRGGLLESADLFAAARAHSNPRLSSLARKIAPRYTWDDIVLPADQMAILREIVATVRERPKVLEEWAVGKKLASSDGVTLLFAGPPGTGKTMAAEVIAAALRLDLYKIDLSTIVSKYIGETEKNLERIFSEAQNSNAILFFDEADAIFGKRSEVKDAHDRYANIEVSYLLQRMEAYDGVAILATNLRANLDEAFTRRLQFAVDFPFPEEEDRRRIWETLFPATVPSAPGLDFGLLARRFKLAGGGIRNVIVTAAFLAAAEDTPVTMQHLLHGVRRELQKMGRLVNDADMRID